VLPIVALSEVPQGEAMHCRGLPRRVAVTPISSDGLSCSSPPSWALELLSLFDGGDRDDAETEASSTEAAKATTTTARSLHNRAISEIRLV
jgi:hypothetical protein